MTETKARGNTFWFRSARDPVIWTTTIILRSDDESHISGLASTTWKSYTDFSIKQYLRLTVLPLSPYSPSLNTVPPLPPPPHNSPLPGLLTGIQTRNSIEEKMFSGNLPCLRLSSNVLHLPKSISFITSPL